MFILLSKLLPLLLYPLGLACILIGLALLLARRPRLQRLLLATTLILLLSTSNRWAAMAFARSLEWRYPPLSLASEMSESSLPLAEVIVLLGGGTESANFPRPIVEVNGAGDRLIYAAYLYHQGLAPNILVTGSRMEWLSPGDAPAEEMVVLLEWMGVPREAIWIVSNSRNTYEDALYSRSLLQEKGANRVLLVTSAMHMPRSINLFVKQGLEVIPAPVDYTVTQAEWEHLTRPSLATQAVNWLPSVNNLGTFTSALKEYLGILVYRLRGWL